MLGSKFITRSSSAAVIMIGLGSILMGAIMKIQDDNKLITRIFLLVVGLIVVGVVIALIASRFS